jgi:predicted GH43/DUF377 family glycosyl hydrolase
VWDLPLSRAWDESRCASARLVVKRDGYFPNVVYSCGGLVHAGTLVLSYGIGDAAVGVATVPLDDLLAALDA